VWDLLLRSRSLPEGPLDRMPGRIESSDLSRDLRLLKPRPNVGNGTTSVARIDARICSTSCENPQVSEPSSVGQLDPVTCQIPDVHVRRELRHIRFRPDSHCSRCHPSLLVDSQYDCRRVSAFVTGNLRNSTVIVPS
jgi:hypothetical protein